jgi:hypothetical protein
VEQRRLVAAHNLPGHLEGDYIALQFIIKLHRNILLLSADSHDVFMPPVTSIDHAQTRRSLASCFCQGRLCSEEITRQPGKKQGDNETGCIRVFPCNLLFALQFSAAATDGAGMRLGFIVADAVFGLIGGVFALCDYLQLEAAIGTYENVAFFVVVAVHVILLSVFLRQAVVCARYAVATGNATE